MSTQNKQMAQFFASMTERMSRTDLDLATIRDVYENLHLAAREPEGVCYAEVDIGGPARVVPLSAVAQTKESWYEAELYRLKGELLSRKGETRWADADAEAESCFSRALEVSGQRSAKSLELRAAISLSRLWQKQGKRGEARQMLAGIYGWFTEGFDTADLMDAKALLAELGCA